MRTPKKNEPNFTFMTDEEVREYSTMMNRIIGAYRDIADCSFLERVWKDLENERIDRMGDSSEFAFYNPKEKKLVGKKKLIKSPVGKLKT